MNIKTCSLRIVVNPQGEPSLQFRARRLIEGESGLVDAGWMAWETVPVVDDTEVKASGGRHTCRQIYSGASGCGITAGESTTNQSCCQKAAGCDGLNLERLQLGCGSWTV